MRRRARKEPPKRAAGPFPNFLIRKLGRAGRHEAGADGGRQVTRRNVHASYRKPLLLLTDEKVGLALRQRLGLPWPGTLAFLRLRHDPMRLAYA